MLIEQTSNPAELPISLPEAKDHLRVTAAEDDEYITALVRTATQYVEDASKRALVSRTYRLLRPSFAADDWLESGRRAIRIPRPPLVSVDAVKYLDEDLVEQTVASADYQVLTNRIPGAVYLVDDGSWPSAVACDREDVVRIEFTAGYGAAAAVPGTAKSAIRLLVDSWYRNRGAASSHAQNPVPHGVGALLDSLKWTA